MKGLAEVEVERENSRNLVEQEAVHPGAKWKLSDLQVHTPRDPNWKGSKNLPGGSPEGERARRDWAVDLLSAAQDKGIQALAITDHHDLCMVQYVADVARENPRFKDIWIFPGMEITCKDSCQALLIFDVNTEGEQSASVFGVLPKIRQPAPTEAKAPQAKECGRKIEQLIESVYSDIELKSRSIILPHAGGDGAHKTVLRKGFHPRFAALNCDGVYTEASFGELSQGTKDKIFGRIPDWGLRRRGLITTGDNRKADFEDLGANPCWIRLGESTAEAIRQALLVDEARVTYEEPRLPSHQILEVNLETTLTGRARISFNDGFTAIIGGRGAGKSALLEYLRFGLGRSSLDIETKSPEEDRLQSLLQDTLRGGKVEVVLERDGVIEKWSRSLDHRETIKVQSESDRYEEIAPQVARERFRARAYAQKQLSTMALSDSPQKQLTTIAAAESWRQRRSARERIQLAQNEVDQKLRSLVALWRIKAKLKRRQSSLSDAKLRLEAQTAKLSEGGLSPEDSQILGKKPKYDRGASFLGDAAKELDRSREELSDLKESILSAPESPTLSDGDVDQTIQNVARLWREVRSSVLNALEDAEKAMSPLGEGIDQADKTFQKKREKFGLRYQAAVSRQDHAKELVKEQQRIQGEVQTLEAEISELQLSQREQGSVGDDFSASRSELKMATRKQEQLMVRASSEVEGASGGLLRAEVSVDQAPREYLEALSALVAGSGLRDADDRLREWVTDLTNQTKDDEETPWQEFANSILALLEWKTNLGNEIESVSDEDLRERFGGTPFAGLTARQTARIFENITIDTVVAVVGAVAESGVVFEYREAGGWIRFDSASPGQQAAALLQLLLSQEAGTLIIDQPEEDLDSQVVMKIVRLLRRAKRARQVVFATHDPNFVVNGDADKVIALRPAPAPEEVTESDGDAPRIQFWRDGALETLEVRDAVIETLDGGQEAFELRRRKYSLSTLA